MIELNPNRARKIIVPGAFFFLALLAVCIHSMELEVILTPLGLRAVACNSSRIRLLKPADINSGFSALSRGVISNYPYLGLLNYRIDLI